MRKRKTNIRNTVTPDPIDFYMEIKERGRNSKSIFSGMVMRKNAAAEMACYITISETATAGTSSDEAC